MPGYALPMTHPYGITLNRVWTEWATNYGVSSTVAAAVFLISEARPIHEVTAKLAPDEFEQVADIVSRWPDCFPPGTPAALKSRRQTPSLDSPAVSVSTDQEPRQRHVGTSPAEYSERRICWGWNTVSMLVRPPVKCSRLCFIAGLYKIADAFRYEASGQHFGKICLAF